MFSDTQVKKIVGKKWQIILAVTKFCLSAKFYAVFFSTDKVSDNKKILGYRKTPFSNKIKSAENIALSENGKLIKS